MTSAPEIVDLATTGADGAERAARMLVEGFRDDWPDAWPSLDAARIEVAEMLDPGRIARAAVDGTSLLGWIGGIPQYDGRVMELHPLVVHADHAGRGIGRSLVADLERCAARHGAATILLGTDDETGMTSLSGEDLYPDVWEHVRKIRNLRRHPFGFYRRLGYAIVGVVPDANGPGRPDILMAKRIRPES